jgi:CheY-like chemotaxis protein
VTAAETRPLMIVDDDDDLRDILSDIMVAQGYRVAAYDDARKALAALEDGEKPFLILLDLMMPGMSGWEFRAAQLGNPGLALIPVAVLTAASSLTDSGRTLSNVETLRKPFALDSALTLVGRYAGVEPLEYP